MYFREIMKNVVLPFGSPSGSSPGAMVEEPDWKSDAKPVFQLGSQHGEKLKSILPKIACTGGACDGMMPTCQTEKVNPIDIKQIVFRTSRTFKWRDNNAVSPQLRHSVAYGLAVMPEAVELGDKELETESTTPAPATQPATTTAAPATEAPTTTK